MIGEVKIMKSGLYTSIQDLGRFGFCEYGVPMSGPMDLESFNLANALLGNDANNAVLEWTLQPPILKFNGPTFFCCTGANAIPKINGKKMKINCRNYVGKNDVLEFEFSQKGVYGYIAVKGGFLSSIIMGSRCYYNSITKSAFLKKGDRVGYFSQHDFNKNFASLKVENFTFDKQFLEVFKGPEFDELPDDLKSELFSSEYTVSKYRNRMAIQLNELIPNQLSSILTAPVLPGTVQLTPSGQLIVLMKDCQTTGGYPRVLQLAVSSIGILAQKRTNESVRFVLQKSI